MRAEQLTRASGATGAVTPVRDSGFLLRQRVIFELKRRFPERFAPRCALVMFRDDVLYPASYIV